MERIKEAVERARREREAREFAFGQSTGVAAAARRTATPDSPAAITYTKTRTIEVPRATLRKHRIVSGFDPCSFTEAFKILSTRVSRILREQHWNTLAVTSPGESEGKTLVAINLAVSLAMEFHQTCLLVEADLRKPSLHRYFGIEPALGLSDYLASDLPIDQLLLHPGIPGLVVLPGGTPQRHSSEMLGWRKMGDLVDELKARYPSRTVIFDLPPMLGAADVLAFAPHMEAALLVVEEGKTQRDEIRRAAELLSSTHLIGSVLNKSDEPARSIYGEL